MPLPTPVKAFALWLDERCAFLRHLEAEAEDALRGHDNDRYYQLMQQKALFLSALPDGADELLQALPADKRQRAVTRLNAFSRSAEKALEVDSPFYMAALLYPENHKKGEPNNLELLAKEAAAWE